MEEKLMISKARVGWVICPICEQTLIGRWPYEDIVAAYKHTIKRWLTGHWTYGKWLKQYYEDLAKIKKGN